MQNCPTKNAPLDMEKWREIIDGWSKSGENQKNYCQRLWINLIRSHMREANYCNKKNPKVKFLPLAIKHNEEEKISLPSIIVRENPHGYKLHLSASLSLEQLTKLFKLSGWNDA